MGVPHSLVRAVCPCISSTAAMPASKKAAKKAKKSGSNVFDAFTQKQIAEFKEGFQIMDADKDGIISKSDLANTFTEIGREADEGLLDEMLGDAPGPINFTTLLHMFSSRSSGESDDDDVVMASIRAFEKNAGQIEADSFRTMLMSFGDKFTAAEAEEAFQMFGLSRTASSSTPTPSSACSALDPPRTSPRNKNSSSSVLRQLKPELLLGWEKFFSSTEGGPS